MADKKITSMNTTTTPAASDLMLVVVDPSGTPLNKTVTIENLQSAILSSKTDSSDVILKQYDGTEVARIHDGAVVPTAAGTSTSLSAGTGFGYRRRVIALGSGNDDNVLTLTAADSGSIIYVTPTNAVNINLPLVGTETGIWFDIIIADKVDKAFTIKTSGQDGNDNITIMNQYVGPSQNADTGGMSGHDILTFTNAKEGSRIELINVLGGNNEMWHAWIRSLGSQQATIA